MDRFTELETFVAVAEAGGFNAAARKLGRSAPSVTRIVAGLEKRIGVRLLTRTTRQVSLTEPGRRLFSDAKRVLDDLARAEASAAGAHEAPQGLLSVTAPAIFGRMHVAPLLREFVEAHPRVTARTLFVDRVVNLIEEGIDVAVRLGELPDSSLTALKLGEVRRVVVASPAYLAEHGTPQRLDDLSEHRIAAPSVVTEAESWRFVARGESRSVALAPALSGNTIDMAIDAAIAGWAMTRVMSYQVADALGDGRLVEVLEGTDERRVPVHLLHAEGSLRSAKIRGFADHAAAALRGDTAAWSAR